MFTISSINCKLILACILDLARPNQGMESASASSNPDFVPRDYQIEIFEEACKGNVIACLGTGTGKTFIAVMLIKELANEIKGTMKENGKRTFFLVTTGKP